MYKKILKQNIRQNKALHIIIVLFVSLSSLLICSAASLMVQLFGSVDMLLEKADVPHFMQMHSGDLNMQDINEFASKNNEVISWQTVEMLNVSGADIYLGNNGQPQSNSVMEIAFVKQNEKFDFLLNLDNEKIDIQKGYVGVPVYYKLQSGLKEGDIVRLEKNGFKLDLTVDSFIRDAQMNSSSVTSKRFLVNDEDWGIIKNNGGVSEYLIEFKLEDKGMAGEFEQKYIASGMPQNGTAITYPLYKLLNSLSDGVTAAVLIVLGMFFTFISLLCIRYIMLTSLEEDIKEIGIMKAIGFSVKDIRYIYTLKYLSLGFIGCFTGYILSLFFQKIVSKNIGAYFGKTPSKTLPAAISFAGALLIIGIILFMVRVVLRRLSLYSAAEILQFAGKNINKNKKMPRLNIKVNANTNASMTFQNAKLNKKSYILPCFISALCLFLMVTPVNLYSTISSPEMISYMGVGVSDLRIDFSGSENMLKNTGDLITYIEKDKGINEYAVYLTGAFNAKGENNEIVSIKVESGDFSVFPLQYEKGRAPEKENEIALSSMNANELGKNIDDKIELYVKNNWQEFIICGIYPDVTNGGKTAKSIVDIGPENIMWCVININFSSTENIDINAKKAELATLFPDAKVLYMEEYTWQTLGELAQRLKFISIIAITCTAIICMLVTAMFFYMMFAKDKTENNILKTLGFKSKDLSIQYALRALLIFVPGIILGFAAAKFLGPAFSGILFASSGVSNINFFINPLVTYVLCPFLLLTGIALAIIFCINSYMVKNKSQYINEV